MSSVVSFFALKQSNADQLEGPKMNIGLSQPVLTSSWRQCSTSCPGRSRSSPGGDRRPPIPSSPALPPIACTGLMPSLGIKNFLHDPIFQFCSLPSIHSLIISISTTSPSYQSRRPLHRCVQRKS